jgi:hypothetical protein
MPWPLSTPRKDPVPIVQEARWAPGPVWTGAENITPTRIWSPDHPARSQSLYWLSYPANFYMCTHHKCNPLRVFLYIYKSKIQHSDYKLITPRTGVPNILISWHMPLAPWTAKFWAHSAWTNWCCPFSNTCAANVLWLLYSLRQRAWISAGVYWLVEKMIIYFFSLTAKHRLNQ